MSNRRRKRSCRKTAAAVSERRPDAPAASSPRVCTETKKPRDRGAFSCSIAEA
ncbi:hypothetical protein [Lysobacter gummosus]|uniref:hypothetical protein n=1 Tax=Lysobacter gummosus TaxID=262324 RepID=UPI003636740A